MKNILFAVVFIQALVLLSCKSTNTEKERTERVLKDFAENQSEMAQQSCNFASTLKTIFKCSTNIEEIMIYSQKWPDGYNSTMFFEVMDGNTNLKKLSFCFVQIDSLPSSIGTWTNIERFEIGRSSIARIPKEIGQLKKLKILSLGNGDMECMGSPVTFLPEEIGECQSLEFLGLAFSQLTDIPKSISKCKNLKTIDFRHNNKISQSKIDELRILLPNVEIKF